MSSKLSRLTVKGRNTRQRIIEAASRMVDVRGVTGTTLEDVRAEAKASSSEIYHYFTDKEALMTAVIDFQQNDGAHENPMFTGFDSLVAVRTWGTLLIDRQRVSNFAGCPITAFGINRALSDSEAGDHAARLFQLCEQRIRDGYRVMQARGSSGQMPMWIGWELGRWLPRSAGWF